MISPQFLGDSPGHSGLQEKQQLSPRKGQIGTGRAAHPPLAHILLLALKCHHLPPQCWPGGDTGTPAVCSPGAARGQELAWSSPSHCMPELSRNRSHWERLKCGNSRKVLNSSPHRFSKLVQPDVSSCWSTEQQRRLSPCCGRVSRTPSRGQAHFPGSYGWDVLCSTPHSTGAAGQGLMSPCPSPRLACSPTADPAALAGSNHPAVTEGRGGWLWPRAPHSDHAQGSSEMQPLSPGPALGGHQSPLPTSLVPVPGWVSHAYTLCCA